MKKGDVVVLKSGGPKMTVRGFEYGEFVCQWFDGTNIQSYCFHKDMLNLSKESSEINIDADFDAWLAESYVNQPADEPLAIHMRAAWAACAKKYVSQ